MKCPICNSETKTSPVKQWEYGAYRVRRFKCDNCNGYFNLYEAEGRKSYTIPKSEGK